MYKGLGGSRETLRDETIPWDQQQCEAQPVLGFRSQEERAFT